MLAGLRRRLGERNAPPLSGGVRICSEDEVGGEHLRPPRFADAEAVDGGGGVSGGEAREGVEEALDEDAAVRTERTRVEDPLRAREEVVAETFVAGNRRPAVQRQ